MPLVKIQEIWSTKIVDSFLSDSGHTILSLMVFYLIQAALLHPGERAQLCLVQEVHGHGQLHARTRQNGLPGEIMK